MAGLVPQLSGWILLERVHGIDSIRFQRVTNHLDTKKDQAVRHQNSVLHSMLKLVPWKEFERLVDEYKTDELVRSFDTKSQLVSLIFAQLAGLASLRLIEAAMASHQARLYHLGAVAARRSTLSDANRDRDFRVFSGLFEHMLALATRRFKRSIGEVVRLIDSTSLHLAGLGTQWARFSSDFCGAKVHVIYDPDLGCPIYHVVSEAKINDIVAAKQMPIEEGATYVYDLGYYDYRWWAKLDEAGCRIVTRFKSNTRLREAKKQPLHPGSAVSSDRIGFLPERLASNRRNPMQAPVREIVVMTETGKKLRILTNDLDAPAQEIADLYKERWQIELFFRTMKQTLKITHFIGRSENAVRIQVAVALIVYLLLHMLRKLTEAKHSFLELVGLVRTNLMHRKNFTCLRQIQSPPPINSHQLTLDWGAT
jgi:hypothetical protein